MNVGGNMNWPLLLLVAIITAAVDRLELGQAFDVAVVIGILRCIEPGKWFRLRSVCMVMVVRPVG
jgi:hypothetical protein